MNNRLEVSHVALTDELPQTRINEEAFSLINSFQQVLHATPEFFDALKGNYFGKMKDGSLVRPEEQGEVTFFKNGAWWQVKSEYTEKDQKLRMTVSSPIERAFQDATLYLISSRKQGEQSSLSRILIIGVSEDLDKPIISENNQSAIEAAQRLLKFLQKK